MVSIQDQGKLDIEPIFELDGEWCGDIIGYYCPGHPSTCLFYEWASAEWRWAQEEGIEDGSIIDDEPSPAPFKVESVKQEWFRLPTVTELEDGDAEAENQFIFFDNPGEGLKPITYVWFE